MNAIESEIRETQPLTSLPLPLSDLVQHYANDADTNSSAFNHTNLFLKGALYLCGKYDKYRKIRGDGNCYYRAFLYSLVEDLLRRLKNGVEGAKEELTRLQTFAKESMKTCTQVYGYDEFALEMFHEEFLDLINSLSKWDTITQADLHKRLTQEGGTSEYCTWYLRVLTACQLKSDPDRFTSFICFAEDDPSSSDTGNVDGAMDINTYCTRVVEPMGKECGMVQVIALAESMGVNVSIEYLDGRDFDENRGLMVHKFVGCDTKVERKVGISHVTLLYRPGHYDILYKDA